MKTTQMIIVALIVLLLTLVFYATEPVRLAASAVAPEKIEPLMLQSRSPDGTVSATNVMAPRPRLGFFIVDLVISVCLAVGFIKSPPGQTFLKWYELKQKDIDDRYEATFFEEVDENSLLSVTQGLAIAVEEGDQEKVALYRKLLEMEGKSKTPESGGSDGKS